jgi:AcrR family transcriptional regulator
VPPPPPDATGLRQRKRAKVRRDIQQHAMRLFAEQGYDETTVQQIAEAAVISESTFYRYFPTKAEIVMQDELDPAFVEVFRAQPAELSGLEATRRAMATVLGTLSEEDITDQRQRLALIMTVSDLRASMLDQLVGGIDLLASELARRAGRPADDDAVRALAGAVVGAGIAVMVTAAGDPEADLAAMLDKAIAALPSGLEV